MTGQRAIDFGNALMNGADKLELRSIRGETLLCQYLGFEGGYPVRSFEVLASAGVHMTISISEVARAHVWYQNGTER